MRWELGPPCFCSTNCRWDWLPRIVSQIYDIVGELAAEGGLSILVAEQFARAVLPIATSAALMLQGRVVRTGNPAEIEEELSTSYLGG